MWYTLPKLRPNTACKRLLRKHQGQAGGSLRVFKHFSLAWWLGQAGFEFFLFPPVPAAPWTDRRQGQAGADKNCPRPPTRRYPAHLPWRAVPGESMQGRPQTVGQVGQVLLLGSPFIGEAENVYDPS
jgi:hypothetical protein